MFKRALCFFTKEDEREISEALLQRFPGLKFIDGQHWRTADPPLVSGIHKCESYIAYLWPSQLVSELPIFELPPARRYTGIRFQGPSAGPVIQYSRCRDQEGALELGQFSATIEDLNSVLGTWHAKVIAFLKKRYRCGMDCYSGKGELLNRNLRDYIVGKSIQEKPEIAPRLVLAISQDQYLVPTA